MFRFGSPTEPNTLIYINSSLQNSLVAEVWGKLLCHFRNGIYVHFHEHSFRGAGCDAIRHEIRRDQRAEDEVQSRNVPLRRWGQDLAQQEAVALRLERVHSNGNSGSRVFDKVSGNISCFKGHVDK